jgi:predicted TPR repeat methyltransferase
MDQYFGGGSGDLLADRRYALALHLAEGGDYRAAADLLRQALEHAPVWPPLHFHMGDALRQLGDHTGAEAAFLSYLALDPDDKMGAALKRALMGTISTPSSMPDSYIRSLFDQYAPKFEKSLVENLQYKTPQELAGLVRAHHPGPFARMLDLGCGTGLAGEALKDVATHLTGVDLAPRMIEETAKKNLYHALHTAKIEDFLQTDAAPPYDLIVSADVFVYIGALEDIFKYAAARLNKGGIFAFSVESTDDDPWILGPDHRYAHENNYILQCLDQAGLSLQGQKKTVLRQDAGKPVLGYLYVAEKP